MLHQVYIVLYRPSDVHSKLSQIATLTSNLGQQNRGINRVAKTPSLNPPTKMHAFKVFFGLLKYWLHFQRTRQCRNNNLFNSRSFPGVSRYNSRTRSVPWTMYYNYFKAHFIEKHNTKNPGIQRNKNTPPTLKTVAIMCLLYGAFEISS